MKSIDASGERVNIEAEVVHIGRTRDFFGFNRAKHAVVEAAILATRLHLLPLDRGSSRVREAPRDRRQDRRPGRTRRDGPARSETARSGGEPMIRVVAPSRLHFGLFRVPVADGARRRYARVRRRRADGRAAGRRRNRASCRRLAVRRAAREPGTSLRHAVHARRCRKTFADRYQGLVERAPAEHTGLGVGTQLGLAIAKALAVASGEPELPSAELAMRVGRGERSAIGVHGFDRGGLLVDAGKLPGEAVSPLSGARRVT